MNVSFPITQSPLMIAPVDMWELSPILTPCSIIEEVFIMQFFPILAPAFITQLWKITVPSSILDLLEIILLGDLMTGKINPFFFSL